MYSLSIGDHDCHAKAKFLSVHMSRLFPSDSNIKTIKGTMLKEHVFITISSFHLRDLPQEMTPKLPLSHDHNWKLSSSFIKWKLKAHIRFLSPGYEKFDLSFASTLVGYMPNNSHNTCHWPSTCQEIPSQMHIPLKWIACWKSIWSYYLHL